MGPRIVLTSPRAGRRPRSGSLRGGDDACRRHELLRQTVDANAAQERGPTEDIARVALRPRAARGTCGGAAGRGQDAFLIQELDGEADAKQ